MTHPSYCSSRSRNASTLPCDAAGAYLIAKADANEVSAYGFHDLYVGRDLARWIRINVVPDLPPGVAEIRDGTGRCLLRIINFAQ